MAFVCKSERQLGKLKHPYPDVGPGSYIAIKEYETKPS